MNGYPNHAAEIDAAREAWLADMRKAEAQDAVTHGGHDAPEFTPGESDGAGVIAAVVIGAVVSVALAVFLLGGM